MVQTGKYKHTSIILMLLLLAIALISLEPFYTLGISLQRIRVIVGVDPGEIPIYRSKLAMLGVLVNEIPELGAIVLEIPINAYDNIRRVQFIRYVEVDYEVRAYGEIQWNIEIVNATKVWNKYNATYGDAAYGYSVDISVAVIDTGIDYSHNDLRNSVTWCVVSLSNEKVFYRGYDLKNCMDRNGHGTHVAGIIAARLNGFGVVGVAPRAKLYAVRALSPSGTGYVSDIAKGIVEATKGPDNTPGTDDDADVISMSLGGPSSTTLYNAVKYAYSYGVVMVAAAGNEGASQPSCPACYSEVIAVGAININYSVPNWSNRNPDVVAPGVNILSTLPKNRYGYASGTSMACPHVSAAIAIMQSIRKASGGSRLTPDKVKEIIISTAIDLGGNGYDELYGWGLIDVLKATEKLFSNS